MDQQLRDFATVYQFTQSKAGSCGLFLPRGRGRECVRDLTLEQINVETGVENITEKLDMKFKKDQNTPAHITFKELYDFKCSSGASMIDFIMKFEYLYHKFPGFDMKLQESVKAFFVINAANVSEENEKLAHATVSNLTYDNMKSKKFLVIHVQMILQLVVNLSQF